MLAVLDTVRDGKPSKDAAFVRPVFRQDQQIEQQELITALLATPAWETSAPINLTMVGDGKTGAEVAASDAAGGLTASGGAPLAAPPAQRCWTAFILEGRQLVVPNIDKRSPHHPPERRAQAR